ncbi:restriction endonuclease subunit S [Empedobacter falsenii]
MSKLDELLQGVDVEWLPLGKISEIKTGKGVTKKDCLPSGIYPIISGGVNPMGYIDSFNRKENTVTISRVGANAGFVNFITKKFYLNDKCFSILQKEIYINKIESKYLYYFLKSVEEKIIELQSEGGVPTINTVKVSGIKLPIPCPDNPEKSLEIQREIVRVLDELTTLTNQLTTELETERQNRKKQFEFFREQMFRFEEGELDLVKLGDLCKIASGKNKDKSDNGKYILYGSTGIIGKTDVKKFDSERILVARVGANAGFVYIADGEYDVSDNALVIEKSEKVLTKFLYYFLFNMNLNQFAKGAGQPLITGTFLKNIYISIPSQEEQERIVKLLDQFDATHTAIEEEITKEIKLRTQQYEYYREKLLSFPQN